MPATGGELGEAAFDIRNDLLAGAGHGVRNIDAAQESHLASEAGFDGREIGGRQRLERVNDIYSQRRSDRSGQCTRRSISALLLASLRMPTA